MKKIIFFICMFSGSIAAHAQCTGDIIPPVIICPADILLPANGNSCTGTLTNNLLGTPVATDNCGIASITNDHPSASYNAGINLVTWTATDLNGNTATCIQTITVFDNNLPTIIVPPTQTIAVGNACTGILGNYISLASINDNCTVSTITQSPAAGTLVTIPSVVVVTITVTDGAGNTATDAFNVNVLDTTSPVISGCPGTQTLTTGTSCAAALPDYTPMVTSADNCGGVVLTQSPAAGTMVGYGITIVTITSSDGYGNTASCSFNVNALDSIPPVINCLVNQIVPGNTGCQYTLPNYTSYPIYSDNCSTVTVTQSPAAGTVIFGMQQVTLVATDVSGNSTTCVFQVIVNDNVNPVITNCPGNQTLFVNSSCSLAIPDYTTSISASDNCTTTPVITQNPVAGINIPVGTTSVILTVTDLSGNTTTCTFNVIVLDTISPAISCGNNIVTCNSVVNFPTPTATDNCSVIVTQTDATGLSSGSTFPVGITTLIFTATDPSGNSSTCSFTVTVGVTPPTTANAGPDQLLCAGTPVTLNANTPVVGTGAWSVLTGSGIFISINSPTTIVAALSAGSNEFIWTITNGICPSSTDTVIVFTEQAPTTSLVGNDMAVCDSVNSVNILANNPTVGAGNWTITSGTGTITNPSSNSTTVNGFTNNTQLTWTISSGTTCPTSSASFNITTFECGTSSVYYPTAFTPDGDGINDVWEIPNLSTLYPNCKVELFSRWSQCVYTSDGYVTPWDGTLQGKYVEAGTYYYIIYFNSADDRKPEKGWVMVIR